jgi:hypothetical protein
VGKVVRGVCPRAGGSVAAADLTTAGARRRDAGDAGQLGGGQPQPSNWGT